MTAPTTVPVTVSDEAIEHIAELEVADSTNEMLAWLREHTPELQRIDVTLQPAYEPYEDPAIIFYVYKPRPSGGELDPTDLQWIQWLSRAFPPDVSRHFSAFFCYEPTDEG